MTSHAVMVQTIKKKGLESLTNPLLNTAMLCIEGTAAIVRGEIDAKGILSSVHILSLYLPSTFCKSVELIVVILSS
jgi:hypothetical protein